MESLETPLMKINTGCIMQKLNLKFVNLKINISLKDEDNKLQVYV